VKDATAFEAWCKRWGDGGLEVIRGGEHDELHGLLFETVPGLLRIEDGESDEDAEHWVEADFVAELADHLADGWVAILMEVGHEDSLSLVGYAVAVNSAGETVTVDIASIYTWAEHLGQHVTRALY